MRLMSSLGEDDRGGPTLGHIYSFRSVIRSGSCISKEAAFVNRRWQIDPRYNSCDILRSFQKVATEFG
jgi:hypothetical protein